MSYRTLVEFNHDFAGFIRAHEPTFVRYLYDALSSGDAEAHDQLRRHFGVTVFRTQHHSDTSRLTWSGGTADFEECPHG